jgi:hypothetical protein
MWKEIPGYNGFYEINEIGEVRSCFPGKPVKMLKPIPKSYGYLKVNLQADGRIVQASIHRLVADVFVPNPDHKPQVNHKDGNKHNNHFENLEWVTASENIKHSFLVLGKQSVNKGRTGKLHYASKPICQYSLDGNFVKRWDCISDAAREMGCNPCQILNNVKGRNKTCHGYMWRYEKTDHIDISPVTSRKTHKKTGLS